MIVESWAIIAVIATMSVVFSRANKFNYGVIVLPLALVPLMNIFSGPVSRVLGPVLGADADAIHTAMVVIGLVVANLLFGGFAANVKSRLARRVYLFSCSCFTILIAFVFLFSN